MFENYSLGVLEDGELEEAMEIIREANDNFGKEKVKADKTASKAEKKAIKETDLAIERAAIIMQDLNKFSGEAGIARLTQARTDYANGNLYFYENAHEEMRLARSLPKSTEAEKEIRSDAIKNARTKKEAASLIKKCGIDNIVAPDESVKEGLQNRETNSFAESIKVRKELRADLKAVSIYERAVKPYTDAKILIEQAENYTHYEEIEARYAAISAE